MNLALIGGLGYIGARLQVSLEENGHTVSVFDLALRGVPFGSGSFKRKDYRLMQASDLSSADVIIVFAGHSSVSQANRDPGGAIDHNVVGMFNLLKISEGRPFIFASSGSVYDTCRGLPSSEESVLSPSRNPYDLSKTMFDQMAAMSESNWTSLRLGTVNGPSPNMRFDLVVNRMVADAMCKGVVQVSNGYVHRAILALDDLCEALPNILSSHRDSFGLLNIGSFNTTVDEIATTVAMITGAELKIQPSSSTYDFTMATRKASDTFGFNPKYDIKMLVQKLVNFFSNEGAQQLTKYSQQSSQ